MWLGLQKLGIKFGYFFKLSWPVILKVTTKLPTLTKILLGNVVQVTEFKNSVPVLKNDLLSDGV